MIHYRKRTQDNWPDQIIAHLRQHGEATRYAMNEACGADGSQLNYTIESMVALGQIVRVRRGVYGLHPRLTPPPAPAVTGRSPTHG